MTEIQKVNDGGYEAIEKLVISGDLSGLNPGQRVQYYHKVCESLGLNPYTRPFDYITLNGKLTLYAKKDATEQLRKMNRISITALDGRIIDDLYIVTATAQSADGRIDQATGAVSIGNLKGEAKANAIMKAETKAKRRVTLSIAGLGWTDETEVDSIPGAMPAVVDMQTGEIMQRASGINLLPTESTKPPVVAGDISGRFHSQIKATFGGLDVEAARHWYIEGYTGGACKSTSELSPQSMAAMIDDLRKNLRSIRQEFIDWQEEQNDRDPVTEADTKDVAF